MSLLYIIISFHYLLPSSFFYSSPMNLNNSPNPSSTVSLLLDHGHDHDQQLSPSNLQASSSSISSSLSLHSFINPLQLQGQLQGDRSHDYDHHPLIDSSTWKGKNTKKRLSTKTRLSDRMLNSSWTSSVTLQAKKHDPDLKKVDHGDQKHRSSPSHTGANYNNHHHNNMDSSTTPVRVCSDCNTTKTPLWRSGPRGPKSLCNACGIRQRKAKRRAMAVAAANGSSSVEAKIITKAPNDGHDQYLLPYNKRFRDDHISYNKNDQHAITEAAILLMAISSGLVHGCH